MTDKIKLSIVIVNYNSGNLLSQVITSIINNVVNVIYEIIIVDNNSNDASLNSIESLSKIKILRLDSNFGFSKANNVGVRNSKGEFLYFLNPDAFIIDSNTEFLLHDLINNDDLGIIAPQILNMDNSYQYNARLYPTIRRLFLYTFGITKVFRNSYLCDYKMEYSDHSKPIYCDWISGAAFIIRREIFDEALGFDESFFLFYEDVDLCRKVKALGYRIKCFPISKVRHIWGGTSEGLKEFTLKEDLKSRLMYFKKHENIYIIYGIVLLTIFNLVMRVIFYFAQGKMKEASIFYRALTIFKCHKD